MVDVIVGLAAAAIGAWVVLRARTPAEARLELVDLTFARDTPVDPAQEDPDVVRLRTEPATGFLARPHRVPVLDIKLRNPGGQPAFVKRALLDTPYVVTADVLRHWPQEFCDGVRRVRGYPRRPSAQYRVSAPR
jgi:hypothetical protein